MRFAKKIAIALISAVGFAACLQASELQIRELNEIASFKPENHSLPMTLPVNATNTSSTFLGKRKTPEEESDGKGFLPNLPKIMEDQIFRYLHATARIDLLFVSRQARKNMLNNKIQGPVNDKPDVILSSKEKDSQENFIFHSKLATSVRSLLHVGLQDIRIVNKKNNSLHKQATHKPPQFPYLISFEKDSKVLSYIKYGPIGTLSVISGTFYNADIKKLLQSEQGKKSLNSVTVLNIYDPKYQWVLLEKLRQHLLNQLTQLNTSDTYSAFKQLN